MVAKSFNKTSCTELCLVEGFRYHYGLYELDFRLDSQNESFFIETIGRETYHTITTDQRTVFPASIGPGIGILLSNGPNPIQNQYKSNKKNEMFVLTVKRRCRLTSWILLIQKWFRMKFEVMPGPESKKLVLSARAMYGVFPLRNPRHTSVEQCTEYFH